MTDAQLSIPERSALLALMTFVTAASNADIRDRYGFTIDRPVRESLVDAGYITTARTVRNAYVHELADKGWARCRAELSTWPAGRAHRGYRILHGVLRCLDHYLTTADLTLADFLAPQVPATDSVHSGLPAADRLRAAYDGLASRPGAWVGLARLRESLPGLSRQEFDAALLRLDLLPNVSLIPEVNQKALPRPTARPPSMSAATTSTCCRSDLPEAARHGRGRASRDRQPALRLGPAGRRRVAAAGGARRWTQPRPPGHRSHRVR